MKIAWITDSTSSLTKEQAVKLGITMFPTTILFGEESYSDGVDLSAEGFYEKLNISDVHPTTSQPSIGDMAQTYKKLKNDYDIGIAVHVSTALSGTLSGSKTAAEMAGFPLITIDSKAVGPILISLIEKGRESIRSGRSIDDTVKMLNQYADRVRGLVLVGNLEQLRKGGRLSGASFLLGNILQVKPILELKNGTLESYGKIRTMKKAEKRVLELFKESSGKYDVESVYVVHSQEKETAIKWTSIIEQQSSISNLSPSVGVHVGSGTIGIIWFE